MVFRLQPFSRNLRNEISSSRKIYFYDNGIRNALIANFNSLDLRNDKGVLWENFLISERMKTLNYEGIWTNTYFWRTKTQQEIDYLEERDGALYAYEFKWSKQKVKFPKSFLENYQVKVSDVITKENFDLFLGVE